MFRSKTGHQAKYKILETQSWQTIAISYIYTHTHTHTHTHNPKLAILITWVINIIKSHIEIMNNINDMFIINVVMIILALQNKYIQHELIKSSTFPILPDIKKSDKPRSNSSKINLARSYKASYVTNFPSYSIPTSQ
jgi:hypothetical protein